MARAKATKAKSNAKQAPKPSKPKSSKIQKANRPEPTQGVRRSSRLAGKPSKVEEAAANTQITTKKPGTGSEDENILESIENTGTDTIPGLTTVSQPSGSGNQRGARSESATDVSEQAVTLGRAIEVLADVAAEFRAADAANQTTGDTPIGNDESASTHGAPERTAVGADHFDNGVDLQHAVPDNPTSDSFREITREALRLAGWDTAPLEDKSLRACCVEQFARLPSPIADFGERDEDLNAMIRTCVHSGVRHSYQEFTLELIPLKDRLSVEGALSDDGAIGVFCALATPGAGSKRKGKRQARELGVGPIEIYRTDLRTDEIRVPIAELKAAQPEMPELKWEVKNDKHLTIRRLPNTEESGEVGHFITNKDIDLLAVNESAIGAGMIAGPLPDFALITIGNLVGFWFCTTSAVEYLPEPQLSRGIKRKRSNAAPPMEEEPTADSAATKRQRGNSPPSVGHEENDALSHEAWVAIMDAGLNRCERSWQEASRRDRIKFQIQREKNMGLDEVWVAIGSVWESLRSGNPKDYCDAYAGLKLFYPPGSHQYVETPEAAAGKGKRLFMPILFMADKDKKTPEWSSGSIPEEEVGHTFLAVAQHDQGRIQVKVYDSCSGFVSKDDKRVRIKNLIKRAQWLDSGADEPIVLDIVHTTVPQQHSGRNTCGLYTIMNAWALMLGIPIHQQRHLRRLTGDDRRFVTVGLRIINLAVSGHMDSRTIQAFMNVYGYSEAQDPVEPANNHQISVLMDQTRLHRRLNSQRHVDQRISDGRSPTPNDRGPLKSPVQISDQDIRKLIAFVGGTEEAARAALEKARGNVNAAVMDVARDLPFTDTDGSAQLEGASSSKPQDLSSQSQAKESGGPHSGLPSSFSNPKTSPKAQLGSFQSSGLSSPKSSASTRITKASSTGRPPRIPSPVPDTGITAPSVPRSFAKDGEPYAWENHPRWSGPPESP